MTSACSDVAANGYITIKVAVAGIDAVTIDSGIANMTSACSDVAANGYITINAGVSFTSSRYIIKNIIAFTCSSSTFASASTSASTRFNVLSFIFKND